MPYYRLSTYPQGMSYPGLWSGALTSSTDVDPDQNIPKQHGPQPNISPIDVDTRPIFSSRRRISLLRRRNQSQPTWTLNKYLQKTLGFPQSLSGHEHLCCQMPKFLLTFPNRLRGPTNFLRPLLRLPEISSTNARDFKPGAVTTLGQSEILSPSGPLTRSSEIHFSFITKRLLVIFLCSCGLRTPFNVKITITWWYYPFRDCTPIKHKDWP